MTGLFARLLRRTDSTVGADDTAPGGEADQQTPVQGGRKSVKPRGAPPAYDPHGLFSAVEEFNGYYGPARIFYNRYTHDFEVKCYLYGTDDDFGGLLNGIDRAELYRKTQYAPDVTVTVEELLMMERDLENFNNHW